jgi:hypothetical protein
VARWHTTPATPLSSYICWLLGCPLPSEKVFQRICHSRFRSEFQKMKERCDKCEEDYYDLRECDCGRCVCESCQTDCPRCDEWSCHDCTLNACYVCDEEYCENCVDGDYCHGCYIACRLAVAWCCKNTHKNTQRAPRGCCGAHRGHTEG